MFLSPDWGCDCERGKESPLDSWSQFNRRLSFGETIIVNLKLVKDRKTFLSINTSQGYC